MDQVIIFDTTLRDGEQSPGASMNVAEKVRLAIQLEKLGADVIEAGFPAASTGDFEAVKAISRVFSIRQRVMALTSTGVLKRTANENDVRRMTRINRRCLADESFHFQKAENLSVNDPVLKEKIRKAKGETT